MIMLLSCFLFVLGLTALPTLVTFALDRSHHAAWGIVTERYEDAGEGAYRGVRVARRAAGRAPGSVVAGAWTAFFLGQMIVPGVLMLGLSVLLFTIEGLRTPTFIVSVAFGPTGVWLSARQLATGRALLTREFAAEASARRTARFAFVQSSLLVAAIVVAALVESGTEASNLATLIVVCALLTIGQALLLLRAARDFERHAEREWLPETQVPE